MAIVAVLGRPPEQSYSKFHRNGQDTRNVRRYA
jgi:hypothetical protein